MPSAFRATSRRWTEAKLFLSRARRSPAGRRARRRHGDHSGPRAKGGHAVLVRGKAWGRPASRDLRRRSEAGGALLRDQAAAQTCGGLGRFLFTKQWYKDPNDPFKRSPSVMSYDRANNRSSTQDARVWIAGLTTRAAPARGSRRHEVYGQPRRPSSTSTSSSSTTSSGAASSTATAPRKYGVQARACSSTRRRFARLPVRPERTGRRGRAGTARRRDGQSRLQLSARRRRALVDVSGGAQHAGLVSNKPWDWYLDTAYNTMMFLTDPV